MTEIINVIFEKGVLRPLKPLHLREKQQVRIQLLSDSEDVVDQVFAELAGEGALTLPTALPEDEPAMSAGELRRLAKRLASMTDQRLSEIVIEDRGEW